MLRTINRLLLSGLLILLLQSAWSYTINHSTPPVGYSCPPIIGKKSCKSPCKGTTPRFAGYVCQQGDREVPDGGTDPQRGCCEYKVYNGYCIKQVNRLSANVLPGMGELPLGSETSCGTYYFGNLSATYTTILLGDGVHTYICDSSGIATPGSGRCKPYPYPIP